MSQIPLGKYRHFRGQICEVTNIARLAETNEEMVVYFFEDDREKLLVRPAASFTAIITEPGCGKRIPRFEFIGKK